MPFASAIKNRKIEGEREKEPKDEREDSEGRKEDSDGRAGGKAEDEKKGEDAVV